MNLVTGATGLLGSHIVEQLRKRNMPVRVLVRRGSDPSWLLTQGVEFVDGDVTDRESLRRACEGVDVVYHAAARVGDWGPWADFQRITIDGTQNILDAAVAARVRRFVHISSISTYGYHTGDYTVDESYPLGYKLYKWAYYTRSKIAAEELAWKVHRTGKIGLTVIRPAWIYGPRDRATIARLVTMIRQGRARILGRGHNRLNVVYAGNIAEAAITAAGRSDANGEAFNISNDGDITQLQYFELLARTLGCPPPTIRVPYKLAYFAGFVLECLGHMFNWKKPPFVTRYAVWLMGRLTYFSADKARQKLGWDSTITYDVGIPLTIDWFLQQERAGGGNPAGATPPAPRGSSGVSPAKA
ncbi:3 beta-hydroxysteroid dehydrogenase/Delta 5--_4-isomerase [Phycisphaerae bacterium RAS1]|nr:3 beta-hydroxysteroid dehydrogenase/Delta 5-->4-isomerase [Phycisphaerae bacterium RAS1]